MTRSVRDKTVIITGGTAGIGRAAAVAFAREGARVGVISRSEEGLDETRRDLAARGIETAVAAADTADFDALKTASEHIQQALGPVDIWVNNAMVTVFSPFADVTMEEFRRVTDVTYHGYVHGTRLALEAMRPSGRGTIIQVGSALAYRSIPLQSAYCGAKAAARGFTDAIRCELMHERSDIRLVSVHMPAVNTPQFGWARSHVEAQPQPLPPIFAPEVAGDAVLFAAKYPRREYWVGGSAMQAIIGQKFLPGMLDRMMARKCYDGQKTDEALPGGREGNLFAPSDLAHEAAGRFFARARHESRAWNLVKRAMRLVSG